VVPAPLFSELTSLNDVTRKTDQSLEVGMITAECPLCGEKIDLGMILKYGQGVLCPFCQSMLEVVNLQPVELEWVYFDSELAEQTNLKRAKTQTAI
jgi:lysine biosynthesis protein LysW